MYVCLLGGGAKFQCTGSEGGNNVLTSIIV